MKEYTLQRYHQLRQKYIDHLGGVCVQCGSNSQLEFDHIDPSTKLFVIGKSLTKNKILVDAEVAKCQLLCVECHANKTMQDLNLEVTKHGSHLMYSHYKCRCEICKSSWNERCRANRKLRKQNNT